MYQFDPSDQNFSLHVTDFAVDTGSLQQQVVYYECRVTTYIQGSSYSEDANTSVTFDFGMLLAILATYRVSINFLALSQIYIVRTRLAELHCSSVNIVTEILYTYSTCI